MKKTVDQVIEELFSGDIKIKVTVGKDLIFIDGSGKSLKWFSKIIEAYAEQDFEDDFWIKPKGPGSIYFKRNSTHGIYLYNTDFKKTGKKNK
jgi:hypothetical protein